MNAKQAEIQDVLNRHELTVEAIFVPFSQSRNADAGEKFPSLNWRVTLKQGGRKILTTDYSAGCGHAPSYKQSFKRDWDNEQLVKAECETGFKSRHMYSMGHISQDKSKPIMPDSRDVIYSLLMDAEVLDYSSFEDWASSFGYDEDSRQDERIYNDCLKIALQFRKIGESAIAELREAYQDY